MDLEPVIGLEVHLQLATSSKLFSAGSTAFGAAPNSQVTAIDAGLPGTLPMPSKRAIDMGMLFALAAGSEIPKQTGFERKNYFYPDLPKGYQITQMLEPIAVGGSIEIGLKDGETKAVGLERAHLEEDAGKLVHDAFAGATAVDLNRAGIPLLEIVSKPELESAAQSIAYLKAVHQLCRYLKISDGNMAEGSLRCDINISLKKPQSQTFGVRTEIKNVNSFRFVGKAIDYEIKRQAGILQKGGIVLRQTLGYDQVKDKTYPMRSKEQEVDYRYFPDPDLPTLNISSAWIDQVRQHLPELPGQVRRRLGKDHGISREQAALIAANPKGPAYFEELVAKCRSPELAANWFTQDLAAALNRDGLEIDRAPVTPDQLGGLLHRFKGGELSGPAAKKVFSILWQEGGEASAIIERFGLRQISDPKAIAEMAEGVLAKNPKQVKDYKDGKTRILGFFVGQVLKASKGKANPAEVKRILLKKLA